MNHAPNATEWQPDDFVIHDEDAKRPDMLMRVLGKIKTGTNAGKFRTQYAFPDRQPRSWRKKIWINSLDALHDPARFGIRVQRPSSSTVTQYVHAPATAPQAPDPRPGFYYVTVRRSNSNSGSDGEHRRLRGPFRNDHVAALAAVDEARQRAYEYDPRAHWYAYGTARSDDDLGPGLFDKLDSERAQSKSSTEADHHHSGVCDTRQSGTHALRKFR
jgi:hypothetical protein